MKNLWLVLICSLFGVESWAASCCGGGSAFPGVITGDFKSQFTSTLSAGKTVGDAVSSGYVWRSSNEDEKFRSFALSYAQRIDEFNQWALSFPVQTTRSKRLGSVNEESSGMGDIALSWANEFLPELSYSPWKPRGFIYTKALIPNAPSLYDSTGFKTDSRGEGVYGLAIGTMFTKIVGHWDLLGGAEFKYRQDRTFSNGNDVDPGNMASVLLGGGYNFFDSPWRLGLTLQYQYTGKTSIHSANGSSITEPRKVWDTSLTVNYLLQKEWMLAVIYTDQTLWGPAENTTFERQAAVQLQKRWSL